MASQSKGKSSKAVVERSAINWRETSLELEGSSLILSVVTEAVTLAPIPELKKAACSALLIFKTTQMVKENKEAYERLAYDSSGLIVAIWRSFKRADDPKEWLSAEMRNILEDLSNTLENICSFVDETLSKHKGIRVMFSRADGVKINKYREHLKYAMQKFEIQSRMNINDVLIRVLKKNHQISEQILHRNEDVKHALEIRARDARDREIAEKFQEEEWEISKLEQLKQVEINRQTGDERWESDGLKKIEKETRDRKSELERLRVAAREFEEANCLKKAEEEEIAQLKRALADNEDNRQSNQIRARSNGKKSSRLENEIDRDEEKEWEGTFIVEEASSEEEEECPVGGSSKVRRNALGPKRRLVAVEDDNDEDSQSLRSSSSRLSRKPSGTSLPVVPEEDLHSMFIRSAKATRRKPLDGSLRAQKTEDNYMDTDEEDDYAPPPPRKTPRVKPQASSNTLPRYVDALMARFLGFTPIGLDSNARSGSPIYMPDVHSNPYYGASFSPPIGPYGYGVGMPAGPVSVVNAGVGNIINSTISKVGDAYDDSAEKVYRRRSRRRCAGN